MKKEYIYKIILGVIAVIFTAGVAVACSKNATEENEIVEDTFVLEDENDYEEGWGRILDFFSEEDDFDKEDNVISENSDVEIGKDLLQSDDQNEIESMTEANNWDELKNRVYSDNSWTMDRYAEDDEVYFYGLGETFTVDGLEIIFDKQFLAKQVPVGDVSEGVKQSSFSSEDGSACIGIRGEVTNVSEKEIRLDKGEVDILYGADLIAPLVNGIMNGDLLFYSKDDYEEIEYLDPGESAFIFCWRPYNNKPEEKGYSLIGVELSGIGNSSWWKKEKEIVIVLNV